MRFPQSHRSLPLASAALLAAVLTVAGCHQQAAHPDQKPMVTTALITLTGNVETSDLKTQAETLARQAAPDYTIANEIGVRPSGDESQARAVSSNLDSAIEKNFKAAIKAHKALDDQSIDYKAKNGTLVLSGSVKTGAQKIEAESLAKKVPNVQQVVNEIEVKPGKHSSANS